jgi:hypothetical protein
MTPDIRALEADLLKRATQEITDEEWEMVVGPQVLALLDAHKAAAEALNEECDKLGIPHSVKALVQQLRGDNGLAIAAKDMSIGILEADLRKYGRHSDDCAMNGTVLTSLNYPVLAKIWDNEEDAVYDAESTNACTCGLAKARGDAE